MPGKYLGKVEIDKSVLPVCPLHHVRDDTVGPPALLCRVPSTLLLFSGPPGPLAVAALLAVFFFRTLFSLT